MIVRRRENVELTGHLRQKLIYIYIYIYVRYIYIYIRSTSYIVVASQSPTSCPGRGGWKHFGWPAVFGTKHTGMGQVAFGHGNFS